MASMEKIRSEQPVKNTTHNLIQTLSTKLDSAARYGLYVDDAHKDGYGLRAGVRAVGRAGAGDDRRAHHLPAEADRPGNRALARPRQFARGAPRPHPIERDARGVPI